MNENANVIPQAFLANSHNTKSKQKCLSLKSLLQTLKRFISQQTLHITQKENVNKVIHK
jgi:hypothetical protein